MRIAAFIGAVILADVITIGGIVLLVLASPERQLHLVWLAVVALTTFVYGPLMLGSFLSYWEVRSHDSRRYFRSAGGSRSSPARSCSGRSRSSCSRCSPERRPGSRSCSSPRPRC